MVAKNYRLQDYAIEPHPQTQQVLLLIAGWTGYHRVLWFCYPNACSNRFDPNTPGYDWAMWIDWAEDNYDELDELLQMMTNIICIADRLRLSFALGYHFHPSFEGEGRTAVGEQVYRAKPYGRPLSDSHRAAADQLADWFISFFRRHPAYLKTDYLVPVPAGTDKRFDLPTYIVDHVCTALNIQNGTQFVSKKLTEQSQKDLTFADRQQNIRNAFTVDPEAPFAGKVVTVIDDIYDSGTTMSEFARALSSHGAYVQGLTATRVNRGKDHVAP